MARRISIPTPKQIRALRDRLDLTQAEAAARVEVSQSVWSAWEKGIRKPSRQSALLLEMLARKQI